MAGSIAAPTADLAKITIPTGYEADQAKIATRQALAKTMLEQGLSQEPMVSPLQVLGHWAQTWAGKSLQDDSVKDQTNLNYRVRDQQNAEIDQLNDPNIPLDQKVIWALKHPLVGEAAKPFIEAFTSRLKNREGYVAGDPYHRTHGQIPSGQYVPPNPATSDLVLSQDGNYLVPNYLLIGAKAASQGLPVAVPGPEGQSQDLYPRSMPVPQMPGTAGLASAMGQARGMAPVADNPAPQILQSASTSKLISPEDAQRVASSLGPNGQAAFENWRKQNGIQIGKQVNGQTYYQVNGAWYDNPEGR